MVGVVLDRAGRGLAHDGTLSGCTRRGKLQDRHCKCRQCAAVRAQPGGHDDLRAAEPERLSDGRVGRYPLALLGRPVTRDRIGSADGEQAIVPAVLQALDGRNWPKRSAIYLHLMDVHDAHRHSPSEMREQLARYDARLLADWRRIAPAGVCENSDSDRCVDFLHYAATVRQTREEIATLLNGLRATGRLGHSSVIVVADHGENIRRACRIASARERSTPDIRYGNGTRPGSFRRDPRYPDVHLGRRRARTRPDNPGQSHRCSADRDRAMRIETTRHTARAHAERAATRAPTLAVCLGCRLRRSAIRRSVRTLEEDTHRQSSRLLHIRSENDPDEDSPASVPDISRALDVKLLEYTGRTPPQSARRTSRGPIS